MCDVNIKCHKVFMPNLFFSFVCVFRFVFFSRYMHAYFREFVHSSSVYMKYNTNVCAAVEILSTHITDDTLKSHANAV